MANLICKVYLSERLKDVDLAFQYQVLNENHDSLRSLVPGIPVRFDE